jgi:hypothetical protein
VDELPDGGVQHRGDGVGRFGRRMRGEHQVGQGKAHGGLREQGRGFGGQPGFELAVLLGGELRGRGEDRLAPGREQRQQVFAGFGAERRRDQAVLPCVLDRVDDGVVDARQEPVRRFEPLPDPVEELRRGAQRHRLGQRRLVPELVVDRLPAHPGLGRDVGHPQARVTAVRQQVGGGVEQRFAQGRLRPFGEAGHILTLTQIVTLSRRCT